MSVLGALINRVTGQQEQQTMTDWLLDLVRQAEKADGQDEYTGKIFYRKTKPENKKDGYVFRDMPYEFSKAIENMGCYIAPETELPVVLTPRIFAQANFIFSFFDELDGWFDRQISIVKLKANIHAQTNQQLKDSFFQGINLLLSSYEESNPELSTSEYRQSLDGLNNLCAQVAALYV